MSAWIDAGSGAWWRRWDSAAEWGAAAPSRANAAHPYARTLANGVSAGLPEAWYGEADGLVGALAVAAGRRPWTAGRELFQAAANKLGALGAVPRVQSCRRRGEWGADGDALDADRALAGDLDRAWRRTVRGPRPEGTGAVVRVIFQAAANARVNAADYVWSAVAACALIDALEAAGIPCEATRVALTREAGAHVDASRSDVPVKAAAEPLDVDRLLRLTAHPGVYRTAGFAADDLSLPRKIRPHLGSALPWYERPADLRDAADAGAVIAPEPGAVRDAADACEWIRRELRGLGIEDPAEREAREASEAQARREYAADLARWRVQDATATEAERARVAGLTPAQRAKEGRDAAAAKRQADRDFAAYLKRAEAAAKADTQVNPDLFG